MMKTKGISTNWPALGTSAVIEEVSTVGTRQDLSYSGHTPDYELSHLVLSPRIAVVDKSGLRHYKASNVQMPRWTAQIGNGSATLISATAIDLSNGVYAAVGAQGTGPYDLTWARNVIPYEAVTLTFTATYIDDATGQAYAIRAQALLRCKSSVDAPALTVDAPQETLYCPWRSDRTQAVTASLTLGGTPVPASQWVAVWQTMRADGTWEDIDAVLDYWAEVNSNVCTIDRKTMAHRVDVRVLAVYDADGNPDPAQADDECPTAQFSVIRHLPPYDIDFALPSSIPPGASTISPKVIAVDREGTIPDPAQYFSLSWMAATNSLGLSSPTYTKIGEGVSPALPTDRMSQAMGMIVGLDAEDRGPLLAWADTDGKLLTDADGKILLI